MFIKFLLLVLAILMLANEQVKFTADWNPVRKRKILWGVIGLVSLLSIIDLYNDNTYSDKLKTKADDIFKKTETILGSVDTAVDSISQAQRKLIKLDSLAVSTNILLDSAIIKSKELLKLEYTKLEITAPDIKVLSGPIRIVKDSVEGHNIFIEIHNYGGRLGEKISYKSMLIAANTAGSQSNVYLSPEGNIWKPSVSLPANNQIVASTTLKFQFNKKEVLEYGVLFFVMRLKYTDKSLKNNFDYNLMFTARNISQGDEGFYYSDTIEERFIRKTLQKYNLEEYLSDSGID